MGASKERVKIDTQSTAYQSYEEASGLAGIPIQTRSRYESVQIQFVAQPPNESLAKEIVVVPENP